MARSDSGGSAADSNQNIYTDSDGNITGYKNTNGDVHIHQHPNGNFYAPCDIDSNTLIHLHFYPEVHIDGNGNLYAGRTAHID